MIHHAVVQGSEEWLRLRMGRPTASEFERIVTKGGKTSEARWRYIGDLLAELMLGRPLDSVTTPAMQQGSELEEQAVAWYEFSYDAKTERCGFYTTDDGLVGASPDRMRIDAPRLVEIKCPDAPGIHAMYSAFPDILRKEYNIQCQGQLWVCRDREAVDVMAYHRGFPEVLVTIERDPVIQKALDAALPAFCTILTEKRRELEERGFIALPGADQPSAYKEWITEEDAETIIAERFPNG